MEKAKEFKIFSKHKMLCIDRRGALTYHAGALYWHKNCAQKKEKIVELNKSIFQRLAVRNRLYERLFRMEPRFAVPYNDNSFLISWNGALYLINITEKKIHKMFDYRAGMNNPLSIVSVNNLKGFTSGYYFGDYWGNTKKESVGIYHFQNEIVKKVFSFPCGSVKHVHGISIDQISERMIICTGDSDEESVIWEAYDNFRTVRPIIGGSQEFRTCMAYRISQGILYATDTPLVDNAIYIYSESERKNKKIINLPGPCIYSMILRQNDNNDLFAFATCVEPDSTLPRWKYLITNRRGVGVKSYMTKLIIGNPDQGFSEIFSLKKDRWPMLLFQFGNIGFPYQADFQEIYLTPISTKKYDGKTLSLYL